MHSLHFCGSFHDFNACLARGSVVAATLCRTFYHHIPCVHSCVMHETRKCITADRKKWSSAFYVPLSWEFTPNYQFGSLPQTINLVVYPKLPIWFVNRVKLAILSHFEPLRWEKIGVMNQAKLAIQSHFEPLWWVKIEKVVNQAKLLILSHFGGKRLEKL